jgi:hypothetical protein
MWDIQIERLRRERHTPVVRLCLKFIAIELAILFNSQILNLSVGGRSRELHNQKTQRTLHTAKQKEQEGWNWYAAASKEEDKRVEKKSGDIDQNSKELDLSGEFSTAFVVQWSQQSGTQSLSGILHSLCFVMTEQ